MIVNAIAYLNDLPANATLARLYDEDEDLRAALAALFPGFEYPDFSHLTIGRIVRKIGVWK